MSNAPQDFAPLKFLSPTKATDTASSYRDWTIPDSSASIILTTLNARYIHAALGLRYLFSQMGALQPRTRIREFTINARPQDIAEQLLLDNPAIIGLGVYIWNIRESTELVEILKAISPTTTIVIGGPEVSYEFEHERIYHATDFLITGQADVAFAELCNDIYRGVAPGAKCIVADNPPTSSLTLPYQHYSDEDIKNRVVYVEASRGCPFKCEFCLSSLDKTAWPFDTELFLQAMDQLYQRGLRHFKFVDRTFNLKVATSCQILEFFLQRLDDDLFLHFEVIPDKLPTALKSLLGKFPTGVLQFEVGIQTFNPQVQATINRRQNNDACIENLQWLREQTHAHIHADLIFGLPGESLQSFAAGFDQLLQTNPQEIQLGILKRLRGTPINKLTDEHGMRYSPVPPYNLLANNDISFATLQRMSRFARYWDLVANSGRYRQAIQILLGASPFKRFLAFTDWCKSNNIPTHSIQPHRMMDAIHDAVIEHDPSQAAAIKQALAEDFTQHNGKRPACLITQQATDATATNKNLLNQKTHSDKNLRQQRHRQ